MGHVKVKQSHLSTKEVESSQKYWSYMHGGLHKVVFCLEVSVCIAEERNSTKRLIG